MPETMFRQVFTQPSTPSDLRMQVVINDEVVGVMTLPAVTRLQRIPGGQVGGTTIRPFTLNASGRSVDHLALALAAAIQADERLKKNKTRFVRVLLHQLGISPVQSINREKTLGGSIVKRGPVPAEQSFREASIMPLRETLADLKASLHDVVRGIVAQRQGTKIKVIAFISPSDYAAIRQANKAVRSFNERHVDVKTVLDTEFFEDGILESYAAEGFEVV